MGKETLFKMVSHEVICDSHDTINFHFFGDMHSDTEEFERDRFKEFINETQKMPNSYYIGMGDYNDFASTSEKRGIESANVHDTTRILLDKLAQQSNAGVAKLLWPIKDRLIGLISGNHIWKYDDGKLSDEDLAERLSTKSLGYLCVLNIRFKFSNRGGTTKGSGSFRTITMFLCHGKGGGRLLGTSLNKIIQMSEIIPGCDIYVQGHDHQLFAVPKTILSVVTGRNTANHLKEKKQYFVRSGSFMKGYVPNTSNYSTTGLMKPATLGGATIQVSFKRSDKTGIEMVEVRMKSLI